MTTIDLASSRDRGNDVASHSRTIIDITSSSAPGISGMSGNDAESVPEGAPGEGGEQSRGRTKMRVPKTLDNAKASRKIALGPTANSEAGNDVASVSKLTEQPTEANTFQLDSGSIAETRATSSSVVKTSSTPATTPSEKTQPTVLLDIRHEPENLYSDSAARELFPNCLILENITAAKSLGSGSYGRVYALKVIGCGDSVKQRLLELSRTSEVPTDYRIALKTLLWWGKQCECQGCETLNRLRRAQRLPPCRIHLPRHVPQCDASDTFFNEIISLHRFIGVPGIQQLIGYEIFEDKMSGKLATRLEGSTLPTALKSYPASFASKNPGVALVIFAMTMQVVSNIHSQNILHNDFSGGNLLFDEHLNPVCIDFGLGKIFEVRKDNGLELLCFGKTGTAYYASHEALSSKDRSGRFRGYTSTKGDVYAATAVLLDLIFCRDPSSTIKFVQSASRPVPWEFRLSQFLNAERNDVMRSVFALFAQCLQRNPLMRPSAATAVRNAQQFASILLQPNAIEALDRVLDGTLKQYPWRLFSEPR